MKFILINIQELKHSVELRTYRIDDEHVIHEISINKGLILKTLKSNRNFFSSIKKYMYVRQIKKKLNKAFGKNKNQDIKWQYILSSSILEKSDVSKYIMNLLENLGGKKYSLPCEMNINLTKYIEEYSKDKEIHEYEIKILLVYRCMSNIDFELLERCINKCKKVNIYLDEKPSDRVLARITKINNANGSVIEIIKYNKKAFLEYNVVYFADDLRASFPRIRINRNSLVLDAEDAKQDKYNSNLLYVNKINKNIEAKSNLNNEYGILNIAAAVRKIVN